MPLTASIAQLDDCNTRGLAQWIAALEAHLGRYVSRHEDVPLTVWAAVIPDVDDLIRLLCAARCNYPVAVELAARAATRVLPCARAEDRTALGAAIATAREYVGGTVPLIDLWEAVDTTYALYTARSLTRAEADAAGAVYRVVRAASETTTGTVDDLVDAAWTASMAVGWAARAAMTETVAVAAERAAQRDDFLELTA